MKYFSTPRKFLLSPALLLVSLLLAAGVFSLAQNTNGPMAAVTVAHDVSEYPQNPDLLPGKGPLQTWQDFPRLWSRRHAEWKRSAAADKGAVVFLGDSITQGWTSLAKEFPNLHVANRGIGGDTTRGVLYRLQADVVELGPEAVVLLIGTNDIGLGASPEDVADNIREILRELKASNPKMPIIVCRVMPRSDRNLHAEDKIKKLNSLVDEMVKADPQFILCDTWSIYADANGDCSKDEFPDLLHPNAAGYAKWAVALKSLFAGLNLQGERAK